MISSTDTIVAQATPPGRGGITIVRVSGSLVQDIFLEIVKSNLTPRKATYLPFYQNDGEIIDQGVVIYFPQPHSFTGEDVVEFHGHGGPIVVDLLIQRILNLGARVARPGEFSERAFLNEKIDLTQAEAIADLINATSEQAARSAVRSLQGDFSRQIHLILEKLIQIRMYIEAAIDFAEEEIDFLGDAQLFKHLNNLLNEIVDLQAIAKQGSLLREGIHIVIAGEPNVGKSSLLNALSGKPLAIVTAVPGTTRDVLREQISIDGMPIHIIDTAGLRQTNDIVEQEGIKRAYDEIKKADLLFYVSDATQENHDHSFAIPKVDCPILYIKNKIDLVKTPKSHAIQDEKTIALSAHTGSGLDQLKEKIKSMVGLNSEAEGIFLARRRHLDALDRVYTFLQTSLMQLNERNGELAAEELRMAQLALNEITGEFTADDLLGHIFSNFCIGK